MFYFEFQIRISLLCFFLYFQIRNTLADFGVPIAILIATVVDYVIGLNTPKLNVPSDFKVNDTVNSPWIYR